MKTLWAVAIAAVFVVATGAHADTVYLKDGQSVWGREVSEEGNSVVVVRPGGTLRIPKGDVSRIERGRVSIPRYYEPPAGGGGANAENPRPTPTPAPAPASAAEAPVAPSASPSSPASGQPAPTRLSPAPLPPTGMPR